MAMISYRWIVVWVCFAILFVLTGIQMALAIFLIPMSREFGSSVSALALAMTICMLSTGFSLPIVGRVADRYGSRTVVLTGAVVAGVSALLLAFVSSVWQVYLLYGCLFGFAWNGSGMLATTALISRWFAQKRSVALTVFQSAYPLGWFCMVPLAQRLATSYGWRNSWIALGAFLLFAVLIAFFLLKDPERTSSDMSLSDTDRVVPLGTALKTSFFLLLGVVIHFICGFTDVPFSTLWVPMSLEWGIDEVTASYTLGLMAGIVFLGTIVLGPLPERLGYKIPLTVSYMIRTVSLAIPLFLAKSTMTYYALAFLLAFSFFGMTPIISSWLGEVFGERSLGGLLGLSVFMHFMGSGAGIYLFSLSAETYGTYRLAFVSGSALTLVSVVLCLLLRPGKTKVLVH